jgi:O-antigen/teichoic acid export membrane protein
MTGVQPPTPDEAATPEAVPPLRRLHGVIGQLLGVNVLFTVFGLITGPLLARALEPSGRGQLAAIVTPLSIAPLVVTFGLATFSARAVAQGTDRGRVIATMSALTLAIGVAFVPLGLIGADYLAGENETVHTYLVIGVLSMPLSLLGGILLNVAMALERWNAISVQRLIPAAGAAIAYLVLFLLDELTVGTAAAVAITLGLVSNLPLLGVLRGARPFRLDRPLGRAGLVFGSQAWFVALSQLLNNRLDQVVMVKATTSRELGLYAVAVTTASLSSVLASSVGQAIFPRVAAGADELTRRSLRLTIAAVAVAAIGAAALTPFAVPFVFGEAFRDAVPMVLILLIATVPNAASSVLGPALSVSLQRPGLLGIGQLGALVITVIGLIVLLPPLGGIGAAIVSVLSYSLISGWALFLARRHFGGTLREYLIARPSEIVEMKNLALARLRRSP